ncbi:hypothetical protein DLAC_00581 [Tieghemostelium lacteum]|uniref:Uncharacterized protein n=1 Tax=Tieghemostelium lacteum TaxID=361077 RepID=A0A152AA43_TIELA|nr:hypothetical protein DLAC_00581 [Tieghemostelium lacteum]|eukprot:KYR03089.1 hypothetical protein DLAC_00581 [Tieghemostelium lacteum]
MNSRNIINAISKYNQIRCITNVNYTSNRHLQKKGKDGKLFTKPPKNWDESMASFSESCVKADRSPLDINDLKSLGSQGSIERKYLVNLK